MNTHKITITYCPGCRWVTRSCWICQELLITFESEVAEIGLRPSPTPGTFQIRVNDKLVHCRKENQGFPELKVLKQSIRDLIKPDLDLGHSDKK